MQKCTPAPSDDNGLNTLCLPPNNRRISVIQALKPEYFTRSIEFISAQIKRKYSRINCNKEQYQRTRNQGSLVTRDLDLLTTSSRLLV